MHEQEKEFIAAVLKTLSSYNIPISKVLLQKFIYFLGTQGIKTGFRFEPYTYGPYSFELASTIGSMDFWDEIKIHSTEIKICNLSHYNNNKTLIKHIKEYFDKFKSIVGDLTFRNLECIGTTLYCANAIINYGNTPTQEAIVSEFKAWKKNRYSDEEIADAYTKLKP